MRAALICHHDNALSREILPAWLGSFSELAGIVEIAEQRGRLLGRLRMEMRRSRFRLLDVLAFRLYYRIRFARRDDAWLDARRAELRARYGSPPAGVPVYRTADPNSPETRQFLERVAPDLTLARCKMLLRRDVFDVASRGTVVLHPGICPEYRNAHGCFWALARRDLGRVGSTLLRIDEGVDTGPVHGYYRADFDEFAESHVIIQHRVVFDNLAAIGADLERLGAGTLSPIDTSGRESQAWGQPRLSDWLRWKRAARAGAAAPSARADRPG